MRTYLWKNEPKGQNLGRHGRKFLVNLEIWEVTPVRLQDGHQHQIPSTAAPKVIEETGSRKSHNEKALLAKELNQGGFASNTCRTELWGVHFQERKDSAITEGETST